MIRCQLMLGFYIKAKITACFKWYVEVCSQCEFAIILFSVQMYVLTNF